MIDFKWIGWLGSVFLGFTVINRILGGSFISAADVAIMNQLRVMQNVNFGFFSVPIPNTAYFSGVQAMLSGTSYTFFQGNGQIFYFIFQNVTFMIGFALLITLISIAVNAIRGR